MDEKLPYYMAYPMPLLYDDERQNQRDYEYMKSVYPGTAKRLQFFCFLKEMSFIEVLFPELKHRDTALKAFKHDFL